MNDLMQTIDNHCGAAVKIGRESYGLTLDYSPETIPQVNEILNNYHEMYMNGSDEGFMQQHISTYAAIFGFYVGEVLRKHLAPDFVWQQTEQGVALAKGTTMLYPASKAYKQIKNGPERGDQIDSFFKVAIFIIQKGMPKG